jgi:hypothetical protein
MDTSHEIVIVTQGRHGRLSVHRTSGHIMGITTQHIIHRDISARGTSKHPIGLSVPAHHQGCLRAHQWSLHCQMLYLSHRFQVVGLYIIS